MNKVETTSTCGRCGATEVQEGERGDSYPVGWGKLDFRRRVGFGIYDSPFEDFLCPACQEVVLEALKSLVVCCGEGARASAHVAGCPYALQPTEAVKDADPTRLLTHGSRGCICVAGDPCIPVCPAADCKQAEHTPREASRCTCSPGFVRSDCPAWVASND